MPSKAKLIVSTPTDREILMTRSFDAPRELVWRAMTTPELLKRWMFLPPGWTMTTCEDDPRVGGTFHWAWAGPDGSAAMSMRGVYKEVVAPRRIVRTESFEFGCAPQSGEQLATLLLTEQDGVTLLTLKVVYPSKEARDGALASGMEHGVSIGYDQLDALFDSNAISGDHAGTSLPPMPKGARKPGEFCWINMLTPRPDQAREFFGKLLGWTYTEIPGMGHIVQVGGHNIGGLFDLAEPNTPPGTPPLIGVMVKVQSADATCAKVNSLGGKAMPAFDIMDSGRMAVCFDPNGAAFDLWQPMKNAGTDVDCTLHGAPSWFETVTSDADRAGTFYSGVFGWTRTTKTMPGFEYTVFAMGDAQVGGMMPTLPHMGKCPPHWATYFTVRNADEAARLTVELGGKVCVPAQDIPHIGRFCGLTSPQGVMFYVIQYK